MNKTDSWASGESYEPYVGRWSRLIAREFLDWLDVEPNSSWLEVGCGTGALTQTILQHAQPAEVTGVDPAEAFVAYAHEHVQDRRVSFGSGDAMALPFADEMFNTVVSGLVLNFVPDQERALAEMRRVAVRGGTVAAYVWDYAGQMQMMRVFWDAAVELDPSIAEKDEGRRFPMCNPEGLTKLFKGANLMGIEVRAIDTVTHFRDFHDYWSPFLGGQGPAPGYLSTLSEGDRTSLSALIRSRLPMAPDGSISLIARAWAVRGSK